MKNLYRLIQNFQFASSPRRRFRMMTVALNLALGLLFGGICFGPPVSQAQRPKDLPLKISSVSTQASSNGTLVSITADGPLSRAQTWQDSEGYHVIVPYAATQSSVKSSRGVKVRRVGQSLEILVQTKPGAIVTVQRSDDRLNLSVSGKLDNRASASDTIENTEVPEYPKLGEELWPAWQTGQRSETSLKWSGENNSTTAEATRTKSVSAQDLVSSSQTSAQGSGQSGYGVSAKAGPPTFPSGSNQDVAQTDGTAVQPAAGPAEIAFQPEDDGLFSSIFSGTSVLVILGLGTLGLLVSRKIRSRQTAPNRRASARGEKAQDGWIEGADHAVQSVQPARQRSTSIEKVGAAVSANGHFQIRPGTHLTVATPESLYSAYRIDQEVGKLILGQPHRMDVISSRASEDRRAIETSLLKVIASSSDENERRRACEALEEYGFVARECAALLLAPDAFDRTSAARSLGEIKSPTALPFLLEGLYDHESIVRNQAVMSIGELKLPRAIGALLDMARRHPDVPGSLVSRALSACSVEGLDFFDAAVPPAQLGDGTSQGVDHDITRLEPAPAVEELPEGSDDETFIEALSMFESEDAAERLEAAKDLARYQVSRAVEALTSVARLDAEPNVRAQAISSLASINHESVFPAVLIGMADGSREVRAAAARSLSHLSFDRADAYIRVMETTDEATLPDVAHACIQAGIVSQGIDRLASNDRRQAYEAFSIISLLARAKMTQPIIEAISHHPNLEVRLTAVRFLANTGEPEVFDQLRELADGAGICEELKTALLESMYKLDQAKAARHEPVEPSAFTGEFLFDGTSTPKPESEIAAETFPAIETHAGEFEQ